MSRPVPRIRARLARVHLGNIGNAYTVGSGVWELRIDYGPGYRVYYARSGTATLSSLSECSTPLILHWIIVFPQIKK